jgi:16S rRNA (adenine1518-N6/adenine1519-N6)-dimethyltransferase
VIRLLPPNVFWPRPKVTSAIVQIVPDSELRSRIHDVAAFHRFVRGLFLHRRKVLRRALVSTFRDSMNKADADRFLIAHGLKTDVRAEELSVEKLIELGNDLESRMRSESADRVRETPRPSAEP